MVQPGAKYPSVLIGQLFPNPPMEDGLVYIAFGGDLEPIVGIEVRSSAGQLVRASAHGLPSGGGMVRLDLSGLPAGSYDVQITCGSCVEHRLLTIRLYSK